MLPSIDPASTITLGPAGRILIERRFNARQLINLIVVWNVEEGRLIQLIEPDRQGESAIPIVPGQPRLFLNRYLWDLTLGDRVWGLPQGIGGLQHPTFSPDGSVMADGSGLYDASTGQLLFRLSGSGAAWFDDSGGLLLVDGRTALESPQPTAPVIYSNTFAP